MSATTAASNSSVSSKNHHHHDHQEEEDDEQQLARLALQEQELLGRTIGPGFHSALKLVLNADEEGGRATWIVDENQSVRQKYTCLLNELIVEELYKERYEQALMIESEATWAFLDQLASRGCELGKMKRQELKELEEVHVVAIERRELEAQERAVRDTLESSHIQSLRLIGRNMLSKRSLLSGSEFRSQMDRVTRHMDALVKF